MNMSLLFFTNKLFVLKSILPQKTRYLNEYIMKNILHHNIIITQL